MYHGVILYFFVHASRGPSVHFTTGEIDFEMKKTITKGVEARELDLGSWLVLT